MIVSSPKALTECRARGRCEWSGDKSGPFHAAHIFAKGMGGCPIDVSWNLVCLQWDWHGRHHVGWEPTTDHLLVIAAKRELPALAKRDIKAACEAIEEAIWLIRRLPKDASPAVIESSLSELTPAARALVWNVVKPKRVKGKVGLMAKYRKKPVVNCHDELLEACKLAVDDCRDEKTNKILRKVIEKAESPTE